MRLNNESILFKFRNAMRYQHDTVNAQGTVKGLLAQFPGSKAAEKTSADDRDIEAFHIQNTSIISPGRSRVYPPMASIRERNSALFSV